MCVSKVPYDPTQLGQFCQEEWFQKSSKLWGHEKLEEGSPKHLIQVIQYYKAEIPNSEERNERILNKFWHVGNGNNFGNPDVKQETC